MSFDLDLSMFAKHGEEKLSIAVKKICVSLIIDVVMLSPVDTGRFRGNWIVGIGAVNLEADIHKFDEQGATTAADCINTVLDMGLVTNNNIYLSNNIHYGEFLENGHSTQAPDGVVATTLVNYKFE